MKNTIILAAAAVLAMGTAVTAHAESGQSSNGVVRTAYSGAVVEVADETGSEAGSGDVSLTGLFAEWNRAGFAAASKPGQAVVYGRNGYVTSGPGYNTMASLIRSAAIDTQDGRAQDAAVKITKARSLLAASNLRRE